MFFGGFFLIHVFLFCVVPYPGIRSQLTLRILCFYFFSLRENLSSYLSEYFSCLIVCPVKPLRLKTEEATGMEEPVATEVTARVEAACVSCASGALALAAGLTAVLRGLLL